MNNKYFDKIPKIEFKGAQSEDPLSFKFYDFEVFLSTI